MHQSITFPTKKINASKAFAPRFKKEEEVGYEVKRRRSTGYNWS